MHFSRARALKAGASATLLFCAFSSHAIDFGPDGMFSLTGFAEVTTTAQSNYCKECQVVDANYVSKQIRAADPIVPGRSYGYAQLASWQFQPYLGAKVDLGKGFKLSGLLSQRYRQSFVKGSDIEVRYGGYVDIPDYWYEKNLAVSHEDYGSLRIGSMTSRTWSVADYPYGTNVGLSDAWSASGAGYGMLGHAGRYNLPLLDVGGGDLFLEATYDQGNLNYTRLKPSLWELYAQFHKGDLVIDAMYQDAKNGGPGAFAHGPFSGVTPYAADDLNTNLKGNSQNITMVMGRYQYNSALELSGGVRYNQWSGADLVYNPATNWTTAFNVDYSNTAYKGNAANSTDFLLGARYRTGKWLLSTGMVYLGTANTDNPSDRGQNNSALINTLGARYDLGSGLQFESTLGHVQYKKQGLSPMSMPGNASFTNVDSRIAQDGSWLTVGLIYTF